MEKSRVVYLDILKTLSIFLVVYVHCPWINTTIYSNASMIITTIAVPIFFMTNGALVIGKNLDIHKHYKKTLKFIVAVFVWKLTILLISLKLKMVKLSTILNPSLIKFLIGNFNFKNVPTEHLWFMYFLIIIYLIYPFIYKFINNDDKKFKCILYFSLFLGFVPQFVDTSSFVIFKSMPGTISNIYNGYISTKLFTYLSYFLLGFYFNKQYYNNKSLKYYQKLLLSFSFIIGLAFMIYIRKFQCGHFLSGEYVRIYNDYSQVGNLLMSISVFILFANHKFEHNDFFEFIGKRTINIYFIHLLVLYIISNNYGGLFYQYMGVQVNTIRTLFVISISLAITETIKISKSLKKIFMLS